MRKYYYLNLFVLFVLFSCNNTENKAEADITPTEVSPVVDVDTTEKRQASPMDIAEYNANNSAKLVASEFVFRDGWDLRAEMSKIDFETLKSAELEMKLIGPIYSKIFDLDEDASQVIPELSKGQRTLYYFRKMDEAITEGGIENFYASTLPENMAEIKNSFVHLQNEKLSHFFTVVAKNYGESKSIKVNGNADLAPYFEKFDQEYSQNQAMFYKHLEEYIKNNPQEFVKFKE